MRRDCAAPDGGLSLLQMHLELAALGYDIRLVRVDPGATDAAGHRPPAAQPGGDRACLEKLRHAFLLCAGKSDGSLTHECVVDPRLREQFAVAHPTPAYESLLRVRRAAWAGGPRGRQGGRGSGQGLVLGLGPRLPRAWARNARAPQSPGHLHLPSLFRRLNSLLNKSLPLAVPLLPPAGCAGGVCGQPPAPAGAGRHPGRGAGGHIHRPRPPAAALAQQGSHAQQVGGAGGEERRRRRPGAGAGAVALAAAAGPAAPAAGGSGRGPGRRQPRAPPASPPGRGGGGGSAQFYETLQMHQASMRLRQGLGLSLGSGSSGDEAAPRTSLDGEPRAPPVDSSYYTRGSSSRCWPEGRRRRRAEHWLPAAAAPAGAGGGGGGGGPPPAAAAAAAAEIMRGGTAAGAAAATGRTPRRAAATRTLHQMATPPMGRATAETPPQPL